MRDILRWVLHWLSAPTAMVTANLDVEIGDHAKYNVAIGDSLKTTLAISDHAKYTIAITDLTRGP